VLDAQRIYHRKEPRDLTAALAFYCGDAHTGAHGALEDVEATIQVLEAQLNKYEDLPTTTDALDAFCNPTDPNWVDRQGKLKWNDEKDAVINFGRNAGRTLRELVQAERGFLEWILRGQFPEDTKRVIRNALAGNLPRRED